MYKVVYNSINTVIHIQYTRNLYKKYNTNNNTNTIIIMRLT